MYFLLLVQVQFTQENKACVIIEWIETDKIYSYI